MSKDFEPLSIDEPETQGLVKLSRERRDELGSQIKLDIDAGIQTQGGMCDWWAACERAYLNVAPSSQTLMNQGPNDPGYSVFSMPLTQTRVDMLSAQVSTIVTKQNPVMTDGSDDEEVAESRQKLLHRVWQDAKFDMAVSKAVNMCGVKDLGIYRCCPGSIAGTVRIDSIDPQEVSVFPALTDGIQAAAIVGHRTNRRRRVV